VAGARIVRLSLTPIKGTRLLDVESVRLERSGAVGNRRFFVIDERDRMVNGKVAGELQQIVARVDGDELTLELPDGSCVAGPVRAGAQARTRFFSRMREASLIEGPFSGAISGVCGRPLRLVEDRTGAVDRGAAAGVSLMSRASLGRLATQAGVDGVDGRRFRMLIEIDGVEAHAEDGWVGRSARIGGARVRFGGHVGRCLVTSRAPESGEVDLPTLDVLGDYRGHRQVESTEPLPFGIYGAVVTPGEVRVGDPVVVE
jgi:uncharacterized protein YcbX